MNLPPSNATSGDPFRFWWTYRELPVTNICATQGAGFLHRLYTALGIEPMLSWGSELQSALIAKASFLAQQSANPVEWTPLIRALQADLASMRTSMSGHVFGIYVTYYLDSNRRLDAISLPTGAVLMQWGVPPVYDEGLNNGAVVCIDPAQDQPFLGNVTTQAIEESATGIRVGEGRPVPPSQTVRTNPGIITASGLAVMAAIGIGAWWLFKPAARSNPAASVEQADRIAQQAKRAAQRGEPREAMRLYAEAARLYAEAELNARENPTYSRAQIEEWRECRETCEKKLR